MKSAAGSARTGRRATVSTWAIHAFRASFTVVNVVAGVVYAVVMPFVAISTTYLYYDLSVRSVVAQTEKEEPEVLPAELA